MPKPVYSGRVIPLRMFQHPWLSVSDRLLLAYSTFADSTGRATISTRNVAILIGLVGEDGEPTKADLIQLRNARALLAKKGHLLHVEEERKGRRHLDSYYLQGDPVTPGAMALWNAAGARMAAPCEYRDVSWGSAPAEADLDDGFEIDDLIGMSGEKEIPEEDLEEIDALLA